MAIKKADANQPAVVKLLRELYKLSVQSIHELGKGVPDLIVGVAGINILIELKSHTKAKLTDDEGVWHSKWFGQVDISYDAEQIVRVIIRQLGRMRGDNWADAERARLTALLPKKENIVTTVAMLEAPQPSSRLVIIDGPKGVGKSTIAQALVKHLNDSGVPALYHKHYRDPEQEFEAMADLVIAATRKTGSVVVVDRLIWTEWVMGVVTGRVEERYLTSRCAALDHIVKIQQAPHVILHASNETLKARLAAREDPARQQVDMPWELVGPMWRAAHGQSSAIRINNETLEDQERILNYLLVMLGVRGGIPHFTPSAL